MDEHPFPNLKISSSDFLDEVDSRQMCNNCNKSRRYFCYTCYTALPSIADKVPRIKLPFSIDIIKHQQEISGKSTAAHAAVLAPDHVKVYLYPDIPKYYSDKQTVLVFPGAHSVSLGQFLNDNATSDINKSGLVDECGVGRNTVNKVVFIDCTWYQVYKIATDPRLSELQRVELTTHETKFWRHQLDKPNTYLSTIEAIYYCAREYHELCARRGLLDEYNRQYDDILFFFTYFYRKIHTLIVDDGKTMKAYHAKRREAPRTIQF